MAVLELDFAAAQVGVPLEPDIDDFGTHNDVTAGRRNGGTARAVDEDGPLGVNTIGRNKTRVDVNPASDGDLRNHATWHLVLGTVEDARWPRVTVDLDAAPELAAAVSAVDVGDLIRISNLPDDLVPDTAELIILGYIETVPSHRRLITFNTMPAGPYNVNELDSATRGKLDTGGCQLMVARTAADTSWTVHTSAPPKWTTSGGQMPIPLTVAGERISATTVANVTVSYVAAGTAAHASNASVTPGLPAGLAVGDLLLVFAAIRNSGTGTPNTPSGFTLLADMGNARLFGKYAATGEVAPTITFADGIANATTSAQCAAFRGTGLTVHNSATLLNASAQNITYPGLSITQDNCVVLYLGWKADDWTSVAGPGTEIGEPDTTTGDDQGLVWAYTLQTTATHVTTNVFTVTGGVSAISRGAVVALGTDVQTLTVTRAVNGVSKTQAVGAAINVYLPFRLAL